MKGTAVIIAYNRPAFLKLCCEFILKADDCKSYQYIFALDHGYDARCLEVIKDFPLTKAVSERPYQIIGPGKQSNNVLTGIWNAARQGLPVFYIEDDIFVGRDFFTFGQQIIEQNPDILCAILSRNNNANDNPPADINGYYVKENHNNYQGLGSIFNADMFVKYVVPHIVPEYISRPTQYCKEQFKDGTLGAEFAEQDGLIRRIIERHKLKVAFSCVPRCFHAGFFGYHRFFAPHIQRLPVDRQCEQIKKIAFNPEQLRKIVGRDDLVNDSLPVDLETSHEKCEKITLNP